MTNVHMRVAGGAGATRASDALLAEFGSERSLTKAVYLDRLPNACTTACTAAYIQVVQGESKIAPAGRPLVDQFDDSAVSRMPGQ